MRTLIILAILSSLCYGQHIKGKPGRVINVPNSVKNWNSSTVPPFEYYHPIHRPLRQGERVGGGIFGNKIIPPVRATPAATSLDRYNMQVMLPEARAYSALIEMTRFLENIPVIIFKDTDEKLWRNKYKATLLKVGWVGQKRERIDPTDHAYDIEKYSGKSPSVKRSLVVVFRMADGENKAMNWTKLTVKERQYICDCVKKER